MRVTAPGNMARLCGVPGRLPCRRLVHEDTGASQWERYNWPRVLRGIRILAYHDSIMLCTFRAAISAWYLAPGPFHTIG